MSSENIAETKIIILHLVSDTPGITYHMLMEKCMESLLTDFFTFSQCYNELIAGNMLEKISESDGTGSTTADSSEDLLFITEGGKAVLDDIKGALDQRTVTFLSSAASSLQMQLSERNSHRASVRVEDGFYYADLTFNDKEGQIFSASVRCEDKDKAKDICSTWKKDASRIVDSFNELFGK